MEKTNSGIVIPLNAGWKDLEVGQKFGKVPKKISMEIQLMGISY